MQIFPFFPGPLPGQTPGLISGLVYCCIVLLISACETIPGDQGQANTNLNPVQESWRIADATQLLERAQRNPSTLSANRSYLEAAQIYLALGEITTAHATYLQVNPENLSPALDFQYRLFHIELLMDSTRLHDAWQESLEMQPRNPSQRNQLLLMKSRLAEGLERYRDAASALMSVRGTSTNQQSINNKIWQYISLTRIGAGGEILAGTESRVEKAWWHLALALQEGFDPAEQGHILRNWMTMHPRHPASTLPPASLALLLSTPERHRRIALMLPLSGPLGGAGRVVRDGYIAAYLHRSEFVPAAIHPPLLVFDTHGHNMAALYEEAALAQVELIVGPLSKARVTDLSLLPNLQIPVLALNYLAEGSTTPANFFQLGLAIEDEARALAEKLRADGIEQVALIHGPDSWALRGAQAFETYWGGRSEDSGTEEPGKRRLAQVVFSDPRKITQRVGELFAVNDSKARHQSLNKRIRSESEMVPRSRQDIQAVVALVDGNHMRALRPALAFHFVNNTPIYSSSQVLQDMSPGDYSDLEGVRLCEIPWLVKTSTVQQDIESAFPGYNNRVAPLYALGVDAYRLVARINLLTESADDHLLGGTGILRLGEKGRLERQLIWAIVQNGKLSYLPGASL